MRAPIHFVGSILGECLETPRSCPGTLGPACAASAVGAITDVTTS